jgi:hypothetical protein
LLVATASGAIGPGNRHDSHEENLMKSTITAAVLLSLGLLAGAAQAAEPTAQQNKMATCNKDAGEKKGDERKKFMSECLSAKKETQQSKMTTCNKDAGDKKGDERKKFMSECLSAKKPA